MPDVFWPGVGDKPQIFENLSLCPDLSWAGTIKVSPFSKLIGSEIYMKIY
jgi:hypothetical protein